MAVDLGLGEVDAFLVIKEQAGEILARCRRF